jgi:SPOR domain
MTSHDPCGRCGAPLDDRQRYCVVCGESRRHPDDPAARYLRGRRTVAVAAGGPAPEPARPARTDARLVALALALLPVAAAAGVLAGRSGSGDDDAVLAAIKASNARAARVSAAAPAATVASVTPTNDFTRSHGWVVRLKPLTAAAAAADTPSGTGVLVTKGYTLKPATRAAYVLFAGPYGSRAAAARARKRLVKRYPDATVVEVRRAAKGAAGGSGRAARIAAEDAVVRKHPTAQQKADGAKIVQQIQAKRGKSYVEQQQQLPDTIVIP